MFANPYGQEFSYSMYNPWNQGYNPYMKHQNPYMQYQNQGYNPYMQYQNPYMQQFNYNQDYNPFEANPYFLQMQNNWTSQLQGLKDQLAQMQQPTAPAAPTDTTTEAPTDTTTETPTDTAAQPAAKDKFYTSGGIGKNAIGQYQISSANSNWKPRKYLQTGQFGDKGKAEIIKMGYTNADGTADTAGYLAKNQSLVEKYNANKTMQDRRKALSEGTMQANVVNGKRTNKPKPKMI